jgi:hypothetical protein
MNDGSSALGCRSGQSCLDVLLAEGYRVRLREMGRESESSVCRMGFRLNVGAAYSLLFSN